MAQEVLQVIIRGDADNLISELSQAGAKSDQFNTSLKESGSALRSMAATRGNIKKLGSDLNRVAAEGSARFERMKGVTGNVNNLLFNFGALAEDSAFGLRGMANNIPLVTMEFQRLTTRAGGAKNAIAAIISGLASPAGLIAAIGVASAVVITFGDKLSNLTGKAKDTTKSLKDLKEGLSELVTIGPNIEGLEASQQRAVEGLGRARDRLAEIQEKLDRTRPGDVTGEPVAAIVGAERKRLKEERKLVSAVVETLEEKVDEYEQLASEQRLLNRFIWDEVDARKALAEVPIPDLERMGALGIQEEVDGFDFLVDMQKVLGEFEPITLFKREGQGDLFEHELTALGEFMKRFNEQVDNLNRTVDQGLAGAVIGFSEVLGNLAAGKNVNFLQAVVGPIADAAQRIGQIIIATAIATDKFKKFAIQNPAVAIAAGAALVAVATAAKAAIGATAGSAGSRGGSIGRGSMSLAAAPLSPTRNPLPATVTAPDVQASIQQGSQMVAEASKKQRPVLVVDEFDKQYQKYNNRVRPLQ